MSELSKEYKNEDITIVWKPTVCIHSTLCWKGETGLKSVFNPAEKPWIKPHAATTAEIIERVNRCPSGALSFYYNTTQNNGLETQAESSVEVMPNGPLLVYGNINVKHKNGAEDKKSKVTAFCRCGASGNKPYCDGTHIKIAFKDE